MKRAYLIYQKDEAEKNKGFIELFRQAGKREKIDFSYVPVTEYQKASEEKLPDLVLNRRLAAGMKKEGFRFIMTAVWLHLLIINIK